jgi:hypothetical protein
MADYHPLIARAIEGLDNSSGEARRALYERARTALVAQLRAIQPPLSEADITRERLALEDAIRKVETETARKARMETRSPVAPARPPQAPRSAPNPPPARSAPQTARPDLLRPPARARDDDFLDGPAPPAPAMRGDARTSPKPAREPLRGFRDVIHDVDDLGGASARAARSARDTQDSYGGQPYETPRDEAFTRQGGHDPHFEDTPFFEDETPDQHGIEPAYAEEDEELSAPAVSRQPARLRAADEEYERPRPPRSYYGLVRLIVILLILGGVAATVSWQWSNITGLYHLFSNRSRPAQTAQAPTAEPKFPGRVPQDQTPGQPPGAGTTDDQAGPAVAQRVVLYEEDSSDPQGKRYVGSAIWRTDTVSPGTGQAPELVVRADIEIPDRQMTVTFTVRRNTDAALPASHTIEVVFNLPPDFAGGGVSSVPGVLMKQSEQARGTPLAGLAVKVTNGFFLIGLSAVDADVQRNIQLLQERPWFDVPIVYNNGGRAILALEKGPPGDRAFADAFAAWRK